MKKYIIDANLPYRFSQWRHEEYIHVFDINDELTDEEIWGYAKEKKLTVITKDSDFSMKSLISTNPPKVIQFKTGNMKIKEFFNFMDKNWEKIRQKSEQNSIVYVFLNRIESIK